MTKKITDGVSKAKIDSFASRNGLTADVGDSEAAPLLPEAEHCVEELLDYAVHSALPGERMVSLRDSVRLSVRKILNKGNLPRPLSIDIDFKYQPVDSFYGFVVELALGEEKESVTTSLGLSAERAAAAMSREVMKNPRLAWLTYQTSPLFQPAFTNLLTTALAVKALGEDVEISGEDASFLLVAARKIFARQPFSFESWSDQVAIKALSEGISLEAISNADCRELFDAEVSPEEAVLYLSRLKKDPDAPGPVRDRRH